MIGWKKDFATTHQIVLQLEATSYVRRIIASAMMRCEMMQRVYAARSEVGFS
jgi:hypothetical protein